MQDVRGRSFRRSGIIAATLAAGCLVAGSFVLASGSPAAAPKDDDAYKKKDVRVIVSGNGEQPQVWVSGDDDDGDRSVAYLGVSTEEDTKSPDGGARVDSVADDSPADKAGIRRGDTIVSFGGTAIHGPARLTEKIHASKPGEQVEVKIRRKEGKSETLSVEMGERPKVRGFGYWYGDGDDAHGAPLMEFQQLDKLGDLGKQLRLLRAPHARWSWRGDRPRLGVELVETTPELREFLGGSKDSGVLIGKVLANTPAQRAGLKVGDLIVAVDGTRIEGSSELIEAMDEKEGKSIEIDLIRDHRSTRVQVAIPKLEDKEEEQTGPRAMQMRAVQDELRAHLAEIEAAVAGIHIHTRGEIAERDGATRALQQALEAMERARLEAGDARRRAADDLRRIETAASRARLSL